MRSDGENNPLSRLATRRENHEKQNKEKAQDREKAPLSLSLSRIAILNRNEKDSLISFYFSINFCFSLLPVSSNEHKRVTHVDYFAKITPGPEMDEERGVGNGRGVARRKKKKKREFIF